MSKPKLLAELLGGTHAERMARALAGGWDTDVFHGTADDIQAFALSERGKNTQAKSAQGAFWFVDNPEVAGGYARMAAEDAPVQRLIEASQAAERRRDFDAADALTLQAEKLELSGELVGGGGQNIMPLKIKGGNLMQIDADGATMSDLDDSQLSMWVNEAKEKGYDGLKISNFSDNADYGNYTPATHYAIFDPKNIRSVNADFNPANRDSSNLLAGLGGAAAIGGAALAPEHAEAHNALNNFQSRRASKRDYWRQMRQEIIDFANEVAGGAFAALDKPLQGYMGLAGVAGTLAAGGTLPQALQQGARIASQPSEATAYQYGGAMTDALAPYSPQGAAIAGALTNAGIQLTSPF